MEHRPIHSSWSAARSAAIAVVSSPVTKTTAGLIIGGLSLYLAVRDVDLLRVGVILSGVGLGFVGLALLSVAINTWSKAARWGVLLGEAGRHISTIQLTTSLLVGQMLNLLLPVRVGDISRAVMVGGMGPGRVYTLGTVVLEKVIDMLCFALLFVMTVLVIPLPELLTQSAYVTVLVAVAGAAVMIVLAYRPDWFLVSSQHLLRWLPERARAGLMPRLQAALASLASIRNQTDRVKIAGLSLVNWGTAILTNQMLMWACGIHLPLIASVVLLLVLLAGINLPSLPGRIGLFEYLCVVVLGLFGIDKELAFSYGVLLHGVLLLPMALAGGLFYLTLRRPAANQQAG